MRHTITIQQRHYQEFKHKLISSGGHEQTAFILCGRSFVSADPWCDIPEERLLSQKVISLPESEIVDSCPQGITWKTNFFVRILKEAEEKNLAVAVLHSHPKGPLAFSPIDDRFEPKLFKIAFNRNGGNRPHASLIITPNGEMIGRAWDPQLNQHPLDLIRILGDKFKILFRDRRQGISAEAFNRQELAFGKALNQDLSKLRIAIVGCGGTGSAIVMFITRLGVGKLLLIDKDNVDITNLNRLHGATMADAEAERSKVSVLSSVIIKMGLGTKVKTINGWVESDKTRTYLKACDLIFGCTDDHQGRLFLNRMAYFYLLPLIDMGLMIKVSETDPSEMKVLDGRVTVVFPENVCLLCRRIIDPNQAYAEQLRRNKPNEYAKLKEEAYVVGEGNPSPAVITFTTEVATMAINEFIHRIQGFRGVEGAAAERRRLFRYCDDRKTGAKSRQGCEICDTNKYWGRGDIIPFLNRV